MDEQRPGEPSEQAAEVERIKSVYAGYRRDASVLKRWEDNHGNKLIVEERQEVVHNLLRRNGFLPLNGRRILDIGCGNGSELKRLLAWGAVPQDLHGIDLLPDRIADARRYHPQLNLSCGNAEKIPFDAGSFDLVMIYVLMSSILDQTMRRNIATEATRVLRSGGAILWYDFRFDNPYNRNVRGVNRREVGRLFPSLRPVLTTTTVLPPLTRKLGRIGSSLYPVLRRFRFLRTHIIGLLIKP